MRILEILTEEHVLISEYLSCLSAATDKIIDNKAVSREFFEKALVFATNFTDKYHHLKEEHIMFSFQAKKHVGEIDAEIEKLRSQHERGRNLLSQISGSLNGYSKGLNEPTRILHRNLSDYVDGLRKHIHMEDKIFYPMVARTLSKEEHDAIMSEFERHHNKLDGDVSNDCRLLLNEMKKLLN